MTDQPTSDPDREAAGLAEKQAVVEQLFRHTNTFLEQHKEDPLLVVEALATIVVRYAALFGPVEAMDDRLAVLERLIGLEIAQIREIARREQAADDKPAPPHP